MSERGQTIIILILIMTVSLSIGLSIVQKSLIDVSTSTKLEETSRAFSAAEAGIEKALNNDTSTQTFTDTGAQITNITDSGLLPPISPSGDRQYALEFPPVSKEEVTQIWFADLDSTATPLVEYYKQSTLDVYWGNSTSDKAAIELTLIYWDGTEYKTRKWYLDHSAASRNPTNSFDTVSCFGGANEKPGTIQYQCSKRLGDGSGVGNTALPVTAPNILMLIRARLLYNNGSQSLAVQATGSCGKDCSLPPQARIVTSTGVSGDTQRKIQVFQRFKEVPPYFDYALFSIGEISK